MPISYGFLPPSLPVAGLEIPPDAHSDGERFRMQPFFSHPPPGSITPLDDSGDDFPPAQGVRPPRTGFSRLIGRLPPAPSFARRAGSSGVTLRSLR